MCELVARCALFNHEMVSTRKGEDQSTKMEATSTHGLRSNHEHICSNCVEIKVGVVKEKIYFNE